MQKTSGTLWDAIPTLFQKEQTKYISKNCSGTKENNVKVSREEGSEILPSEVETVNKCAPIRRVFGPDGIIVEILKEMDELSIRKLTSLNILET